MGTSVQLVHSQTMPMQSQYAGIQVREDVIFTDATGKAHTGIRRSSEKILQNLAEPLSVILRKGETVFFVAPMTASVNAVEQLTMSWALYAAYAMVLVFTSERILAFPVERSGKWRESVRSLEYGDIPLAKAGNWLTRSLKIVTKSGDKETFQRLRMRDAAKLRAILPLLLEGKNATASNGWQSHCPQCTAPLTKATYFCSHCGLEFKSEKKLLLRSLLPGGGYFYAGLTAAGVLAVFLEAIFLLEIVFAISTLGSGNSATKSDGVSIFILFALLLLFEKSITYMHARRFIRGFLPANKIVRSARMTA